MTKEYDFNKYFVAFIDILGFMKNLFMLIFKT